MGNIIISIKRFFQNKNTVTIFAILVAVGIIYFAYNYRIKKSTEPVSVPYATKELGPRTYITTDMVSTRKVPGGVVTKNVLTSTSQIIGKYVSNEAVIPEGSLFYSTMVIDWEEFPSSIFANIPEGQTVYSLQVDSELTYGNSIFPGNYIDLYYKTYDVETSKVWIGKFIECIEVLDVEDNNGNSVFETNGTPLTPTRLIFTVPDDVYLLFKKIERIAPPPSLFPVQRNADYSKNAKENGTKATVVGNDFVEYVNSKTVNDDIIYGGK